MSPNSSFDSGGDRSLVGLTPRRVKVYLLQGEDWIDNGTGYCTGEIEEDSKKPYFLVRNELNTKDIILKSFLEGSIQYQRQQETLIVWTDLTGKDIALSFQETEGCADLCEFIIKVQQEDFSPDISLYYVIPNLTDGDDITELITGPVNFPERPTLDNLDSITDVVNQGSNSQYSAGRISKYIIEEQYLLQLIEVFHQAEKSHSLGSLFSLSEIVKTLILYNDTELIEDFLSSEEKIMGLMGILEFDPEYPDLKACHRYFLSSKSFKTVIPVDNISIFKRDFHLNFLKDVVLARFLDDQTFNLLSSLIHSNQIEVINYLKDPKLLTKLFRFYDTDDVQSKRDGVRMLHQYVLIAKSLQTYQKLEFFSALVKNGLFNMISFALNDEESIIRVLGTELIVVIIEQDVSLVNSIDRDDPIDNCDPPDIALNKADDHMSAKLKNGNDETDNNVVPATNIKLKLSDDMTLIKIMSNLLINDKNPGLKFQAFEALRMLLDSNIASNSMNSNKDFDSDQIRDESAQEEDLGDDFNDINTNKYFSAFYSQVAGTLFRSLIDISSSDHSSESSESQHPVKQDDTLLQHLCELVSFCLKEHDFETSRPFFIENNVLEGVGKVLKTDCKVSLKLSAIRCLKCVILQNDREYCEYIVDHQVLSHFFEYFAAIVNENNLANSTCIDLIEIIIKQCDPNTTQQRENFKMLATYIYDHYKEFCQSELNYVATGRNLINLVESKFFNRVKNDTSLDSDESFQKHNVSTPIFECDEPPQPDIKAAVEDKNGVDFISNNESSDMDINGVSSAIAHVNVDVNVVADLSNSTDDSETATTVSPKPTRPINLFEDIENDMKSAPQTENMMLEDNPREKTSDAEFAYSSSPPAHTSSPLSATSRDDEAVSGGSGTKRLSSQIKNRFSNATKKIALGLGSPPSNGTTSSSSKTNA